MPFIWGLQLVLFILWFVPPLNAVVPGFVFFLPLLIALGIWGFIGLLALAVVVIALIRR